MDFFRATEALMRMDDEAWARHANPWSGYTRFASAVPLFFAIYSAHWMSWWALFPVSAVLVWTYLNPRVFSPPMTTQSWMTRGVLGERVFLNRKAVPIPAEHERMANLTTVCAVLFAVVAVYGFWVGEFWTAFAGFFGAVLAKTWFVDRMVWLWEHMKTQHPVYAAWNRADWTAKL
ncbi:MAG: DUF6653 family protein [Pseudomonadota bacterium]